VVSFFDARDGIVMLDVSVETREPIVGRTAEKPRP
jgi:hypothetical protein